MRLRIWLAGLAAAVLLAAGGAATVLPTAGALAASGRGASHHGLSRVYAPYFETWTKDSIPVLASKSGAKFFTLAFIQAAGKKGAAACTITWDGARKQPISAGRYKTQIDELREHAGTVFLVAHNLGEIEENCNKVIWLEKGKIVQAGDDVTGIIDAYLMASGGERRVREPVNA